MYTLMIKNGKCHTRKTPANCSKRQIFYFNDIRNCGKKTDLSLWKIKLTVKVNISQLLDTSIEVKNVVLKASVSRKATKLQRYQHRVTLKKLKNINETVIIGDLHSSKEKKQDFTKEKGIVKVVAKVLISQYV